MLLQHHRRIAFSFDRQMSPSFWAPEPNFQTNEKSGSRRNALVSLRKKNEAPFLSPSLWLWVAASIWIWPESVLFNKG